MADTPASVAKATYDGRVARLAGKALSSVVYHEIDYGDGVFHFFDRPSFDSLDLGLDLHFLDGDQLTLTWGGEFEQYGVSLADGPAHAFTPDHPSLDVTSRSRWTPLLGVEVTSALVSWQKCWESDISFPDTDLSTIYPQAVVLNFPGNVTVVIAASEIRDDCCLGMMDHISVFFDLATAKRYAAL